MKNFSENSIEGLTGGMVEGDILGHQDVGWGKDVYLEARGRDDRTTSNKLVADWLVSHNIISGSDRPLFGEELKKALIHYFEENPGWDPGNPQSETDSTVNDLHAFIADQLTEDFNELKFYRTNDSPLDTLFGIDAFFEFRGRVLTVDVTANPHKISHKADIIIQARDLTDTIGLELVAKSIVNQFKRPPIRIAS